MTERRIYLEDIPLTEAQRRLAAALQAAGRWEPLGVETVPLDQARGRVTAGPVWAALSAPHYHAAAMDGYAVAAAATAGASERTPVRLAVSGDGPARYVDTGDPLPAWADAVAPVEVAQTSGPSAQPEAIELQAALAPWAHVRAIGEDMVATELVLPANTRLRPVDLGALAGSGHATVSVWRRPRVAVIPTGTELVQVGRPLKPGDIIEYNSLVLAAQVEQWGGVATRWPIVPDDLAQIVAAVRAAATEHDLVLLNAGSSAGSEDYSARAVEQVGTLLVHGVAVRPGHPVIIGMTAGQAGVPIIGVPGYPVSAALTAEIFVEPLLARWQGQPAAAPPTLPATLTRKVLSPLGDDEYLRVTVGRVGERVVATPLSRGAGVITSLVRADGLVIIPRHHEGYDAGATVNVRLYRPLETIERTLVVIGSHDLTLDLLAQRLAEYSGEGGPVRLASANVGSQGGLIALRRGEAHLAGSHLLDPETGQYNLPAIRRYLPETPVVVVALVGREQGLMVPAGNPQGLRTLADLGRPEVRFVNRQRGAGTRVLLDFELGKIGLPASDIPGYAREEYTHLGVAAAIASGTASAGLGIAAAAQALGLDFVPLFKEQYQLVIPQVYADSPLLRPLRAALLDRTFQAEVAALPGYEVSGMGTIVAEVP
ncbi:MAG: molybdopterin biosynthesis protein [Anaerolineales bacterium]|nr:molybdopterin biosynthesis protein [Anaerolineales bacterium]